MIIPGFTDYDISEAGVVTKVATGKVVKHQKVKVYGYYEYVQVVLFDSNGKRHTCNVLRLLAMAFLGVPTQACTARAKDGNNANVVLSNVEWVPYAATTTEAWRNGSMKKRRARPSSVTEDFIDLLYDTLCLYDEPVTVTELSNVLDVPYSTARYGMIALRNRGKATKVMKGFEAIQ